MLVTDGGFRPDGAFVHLPLHEVSTLTEAFRRAVLKMFVKRVALDPPEGDMDPGLAVLLGGGVLGLTGMVVGAAMGAAIKTDRWEEVPLDQLRVSLVPQEDGRFALGVSVRF